MFVAFFLSLTAIYLCQSLLEPAPDFPYCSFLSPVHILCLLPPFPCPFNAPQSSHTHRCCFVSTPANCGIKELHLILVSDSSGVCLASCTEGMFCASDPKGGLESQNCWILDRERMSSPQRKCGKVPALCCCSSWGIELVPSRAKGDAL